MRLKDITPEQWASLTVAELATLTGRDPSSVRKAAARLGIEPVRKRGEPCRMINVYLSQSVIDAATAAAAAAGMSRSAYLTQALTMAIDGGSAGGAEECKEGAETIDKSTKTGILPPSSPPTAAEPLGERCAKTLDLSTKNAAAAKTATSGKVAVLLGVIMDR